MHSLSQIVQHFKQNWLAEIEPAAIEHACRLHGCRWRDRVLTPVVTVQVFLLQVLHGNTACTHLSKLANLCLTAAAYSAARQRLKLAVLVTLLQRSVEQVNGDRRVLPQLARLDRVVASLREVLRGSLPRIQCLRAGRPRARLLQRGKNIFRRATRAATTTWSDARQKKPDHLLAGSGALVYTTVKVSTIYGELFTVSRFPHAALGEFRWRSLKAGGLPMFTAYGKIRKQRRLHRDVTFVTSSDISGSFLTLVQQRQTEVHFPRQCSFASLTVLGAGEWSFGRFFAGRGGMSLLDVIRGGDGWGDERGQAHILKKMGALVRFTQKQTRLSS